MWQHLREGGGVRALSFIDPSTNEKWRFFQRGDLYTHVFYWPVNFL
jgi:hypothetical protein